MLAAHDQLTPVARLHGPNPGVYAFSPDGQFLATAGSDGIIYLWNAADGLFLRTLEGHSGSIRDLAFSLDGHLLASVSADGSLRLWGVP